MAAPRYREFKKPEPFKGEKKSVKFDLKNGNAKSHIDYLRSLDLKLKVVEAGEEKEVSLNHIFEEMQKHKEDTTYHSGETVHEHTENFVNALIPLISGGHPLMESQPGEKGQQLFVLAGLLHDTGKVTTKLNTRHEKGLEISPEFVKGDFNGHAKVSAEITKQVLEQLDVSEDEKQFVADLVKSHHAILFAYDNKSKPGNDKLGHVKNIVTNWRTLQTYDIYSLMPLADIGSISDGQAVEVHEIRKDFVKYLEREEERENEKQAKKEFMQSPIGAGEMNGLRAVADGAGEHKDAFHGVLDGIGEQPRSALLAALGKKGMGKLMPDVKKILGV